MELIFASIISALGGSLVTALIFVVKSSSKIAANGQKIDALCKALEAHAKLPPPYCPFHADVIGRISRIEGSMDGGRR